MPDLLAQLNQVAIKYLSYRPRFTIEVVKKLQQVAVKKGWQVSPSQVEAVIGQLTKSGFLNDNQLLEQYISYQLKTKKKGPYFIVQKLRTYGFSEHQVREELSQLVTPDEQKQVIRDYCQRHSLPPEKLYRRLISRGFNINQIDEVMHERVK